MRRGIACTAVAAGALLAAVLSVSAAEPLRSCTAREWLGLDWPRTLVTYQVTLQPGQAREVRLTDAEGQEVPCQLWRVARDPDGSLRRARLSFMAELKAKGSYRYDLWAGAPRATADAVKITREATRLVLDNGKVAVRMPAEGTVKPVQPAAFSSTPLPGTGEAGVPGPVQGLRLVNGQWVGGSRLYAADPAQAPKVTEYVCSVLESGPLFAEARIKYLLDNTGFYECFVRLLKDDPAVRIDEKANLKRQGDEYACQVVFSLNGGAWQPTAAYWTSSEGRLPGTREGFDQKVAAMGWDTKPYAGNTFGSKALPQPAQAEKAFDVAMWYPWSVSAYYFGLVDEGQLGAGVKPEQVPFVGVVPMHAGNWRAAVGAVNGALYAYPGGVMALHWPLVAAPHPNTLLHTGEYDPALPLSFLRRQWALVGGPMQYHDGLRGFRAYEGYVNLDDYKDWVLEWAQDPAVTYPRLVFSQAEVARLKPQLDKHPAGAVLKQFLYFNDDEARFKQLWDGLVYNSCWSGPLGVAVHGLRNEGWTSSYRYAQMCGWAGKADELLSSPRMTAEQRQSFRAYLAAACYVMSSPDFNPRGALVHLGNPNMPINRFMGLPFTAALIPDHPRAKPWLDVAAQYERYKLAMNTAPGGGWSELLTYYAASAPHLMQAANVLAATGRLPDDLARLASLPGSFPLYLLSPRDPRFGARMLPAWGHEGYIMPTQWLPVAGMIRKLDPGLATALAWAWDQGGRPMEEHHDAGFSERCALHADLLGTVRPGTVPSQLRSTWIPGMGAVLRAHPESPAETYLAYRQGYMVSHCDNNQGDFVLYSKGAPLVTLSLFGYPLHQNEPYIKLNQEFGWHSHVRIGAQTNQGGSWNLTSEIHAHSFSDTADYLRGHAVYGQEKWTRQILFLKARVAGGPDYFLFRDSFDPEGNAPLQPTWWMLRTPEHAERVSTGAGSVVYTSPYGTKLNVSFVQPQAITARTREASRTGPLYFGPAQNWQKAGSPVVSGEGNNITVEEWMAVTAVGPIAAGQDVVAVLYPQATGEALPRYERLAEGVTRVTTGEGTDYLFLDRKPISFALDEVSFSGKAGAVRVYPQEVHLIVAEGPGEVSFRGARLRSAVPAVKVIALKDLKPGVFTVAAPQPVVSFALDPKQGAITELQPGVQQQKLARGVAYSFDSATPLSFEQEGVVFSGTRGGLVVDEQAGTVRMVMLAGERLGRGELQAWGANGPWEVTFYPDRVTGHCNGLGRFLNVAQPAGLDRLPMLVLDGQTYAPGTQGRVAIVPLMPGEHRFELRALPQPPVWRSWQAWD